MRVATLFIFFLSISLHAQEYTLTAPIDTILKIETDHFIGADEYHNLYFASGPVLYKRMPDKTIQFSDIQLGEITSVDILNPLRITVFYRDFNTVLILDNTLNEINRIDFNRLENFRNITHARTASDRRLWLFNADLQQLELFDIRSGKISNNFTPQNERALEMTSNFNSCWILTQNFLYHYNQYGSLLKKEIASGINQITQLDESLFGLRNGTLIAKKKDTDDWLLIKNSPPSIKQFSLNHGIVYIYKLDFLSIYALQLTKPH